MPVAGVDAVDRRRILDGDRRQRRRHLAAERRGVELVDRARAADAAGDVIPVALAADAERRHDADAGDGDAWPYGRGPDHHGVSIIRGQSECSPVGPSPVRLTRGPAQLAGRARLRHRRRDDLRRRAGHRHVAVRHARDGAGRRTAGRGPAHQHPALRCLRPPPQRAGPRAGEGARLPPGIPSIGASHLRLGGKPPVHRRLPGLAAHRRHRLPRPAAVGLGGRARCSSPAAS